MENSIRIPKNRRNKFGAKAIIVDGIRFASKKEAKRYGELKILQQAGQIRDLEIQRKYPIEIRHKAVKIKSEGYPNGRAVNYFADFAYWESGKRVIEDVKSSATMTPLSKLKIALVEHIHNVEVRIIK